MSAIEQWDDKAFAEIMLDIISDEVCDQINLAVERDNEQVSWAEFKGDYQ